MADDITASKSLFGDVSLHVEDTGGTGRPVVLLHGWPLSSAAWTDQVPALTAEGYRVVAYDRRGFGQSDKPKTGYGYDKFADDLAAVLDELDLRDVTLVGFSMGGGEVVRYITRHGEDRLHSIVLAAAVPPMMLHTSGNPDGPLPASQAAGMAKDLTADADAFYDEFIRQFFSTPDGLQVTEEQRQEAILLSQQASKAAALQAMDAFGRTDFRDDLKNVTVPTLVLHGDGDQAVPFEGSGKRTHEAIGHSDLQVIAGAPHGLNVSHADEFNRALLDFLAR